MVAVSLRSQTQGQLIILLQRFQVIAQTSGGVCRPTSEALPGFSSSSKKHSHTGFSDCEGSPSRGVHGGGGQRDSGRQYRRFTTASQTRGCQLQADLLQGLVIPSCLK